MALKWVVAITGEVDIRSGHLHWGQEESHDKQVAWTKNKDYSVINKMWSNLSHQANNLHSWEK